jgi:hypothetical protein
VREVAPFAFRILVEIGLYVREAEKIGMTWQEALDDQLLGKVLPKLKGMDPRLEEALKGVQEIAGDGYPTTEAKARTMREGFVKHGFASYF